MMVGKFARFLLLVIITLGWKVGYGQTGFTEDFNDNSLSASWIPGTSYILTETNQELSVAASIAANTYQVFTYNFSAMDFSESPYLKIRIKSSTTCKIRIDFEDIYAKSTNGSPINMDVIGNNTYQELTYNFNGRFNQTWPAASAGPVDPTQIVKVLIFVNPGGVAFNGTIYLDDLVVGSNTGILPPPGDIKLNQLGFYPNAPKFAIGVTNTAAPFYILSEDLTDTLYTGTLGASASFALTGETVRKADFTNFNTVGKYYLNIPGIGNSHPFEIKPKVHNTVAKAGIKGFYYQRASTPLLSAHAGVWARPKGHPDNNVMVHNSAANPYRPTGTIISSPGGWYDAGDYNKYIVNAGVTTFMLMSMYEHYPSYFDTLNLNIPESGNNLPDLLDEILWEIRWMLTMQDPYDGGVYYKLTTANFGGTVMPTSNTAQRYVVKKSTTSALDFAGTLAQAARIFKLYETELPGLADSCINSSVKAWKWARKNPNVRYLQSELTNPVIYTGEYGDEFFSDEFQWAAMELYGTTRIDSFYTAVGSLVNINPPGWQDVRALGYLSLAHLRKFLPSTADTTTIKAKLINQASYLKGRANSNPYATTMYENWNFGWGSNSNAAIHGVLLLQAFDITKDSSYLKIAIANLDYLMGRNGVNYSFMTGYGSVSPMYIHHRISSSDGVTAPIPGLLVGGPNTEDLTDCGSSAYPSNLKGKAYLDAECSYTTNEIAINWNAPFAYLSNVIEAIESGASCEFLNYSVVLPTDISVIADVENRNGQHTLGLSVYPNPAKDRLVVEFKSIEESNIILTDVRGIKIFERDNNQIGEQTEQFEVSGLNKGLYYLIIKSGGKTEARKVIVE
jgi:endoglucanase